MSAVATAIPFGTYTIISESGGHRTIRLRSADWASDKPKGTAFAQMLVGPANTTDFASLAFVHPDGSIRPCKGAAESGLAALAALLTGDFKAAGLAYALASGRCYRCGRMLTVPASIHAGMGPDCAGIVASDPTAFSFVPHPAAAIGAPATEAPAKVSALIAPISVAPAPAQEPEPARVVVAGARLLTFTWPVGHDDASWALFHSRKNAVKAAGARWVPDRKEWQLALVAGMEGGVRRLVGEFGFEAGADVEPLLVSLDERASAFRQSSAAQSSDFVVDGLNPALSLFPFQRAGIEHAIRARRCIIADEMGLGKTVQALGAVAHLKAWPALFVVPANLKLNWKLEALRWVAGLHESQVLVMDAKTPYTPAQIAAHAVVIINYEALVRQLDALCAVSWAAVVADEAHMAKSPKAQRTKALVRLIGDAGRDADVRLMLTGTPVLNRPAELWPLLETMGYSEEFGGSWGFLRRFCDAKRKPDGKWDFSGSSNTAALSDLLRASGAMVRRRKADVLKELPPFAYRSVPLAMTDPQVYWDADADVVAWYAAMPERRRAAAAEAAAQCDAEGILDPEERKLRIHRAMVQLFTKAEAAEALIRFEALKQAAWRAKEGAIHAWVDAFLADTDKKLVLFAWHVDVVSGLAARYHAPKIQGGMTGAKVEAAKAQFQTDPACRVIVCNLQAGGVGHTLTAASDVAICELPWNPSLLDQAAARVHRIGQTADSVTGWVLVAADERGRPTIDQEIGQIIEGKREVIDAIVDGDGGIKSTGSVLGQIRDRWKAAHNVEEVQP